MKKLKLYLDTCVISYLDQQDAPDKMLETQKMWDRFESNDYDVVISDITMKELQRCQSDKQDILFRFLGKIEFTEIIVDSAIETVAEKFIELGILSRKSIDDCRHIAAAIVSGCDMIVSWNFKHVTNPKTVQGAKAVTSLTGYKEILIFTPTYLMKGETDD